MFNVVVKQLKLDQYYIVKSSTNHAHFAAIFFSFDADSPSSIRGYSSWNATHISRDANRWYWSQSTLDWFHSETSRLFTSNLFFDHLFVTSEHQLKDWFKFSKWSISICWIREAKQDFIDTLPKSAALVWGKCFCWISMDLRSEID